MRIQVVERQPVRVAYQRYVGPYGEPLSRFWRATVTPWLADNGLLDCPRYGVSLDNPMTTPPEKCRYHACVELPPGLDLPDADQTTIPAGRYAIAHFRGTGSEIGAAWGAFIAAVLADPGHRIGTQRQPFEHYPRGATYDTKTGAFACELCLPLGS